MPTAQARAEPKAWWWRLSARSLLARPVQAKAKPALRTMAREPEAGPVSVAGVRERRGGGGAQAVLGRLLARVEGLQRDRQVVEDGGCASQQQAERQLGHRAAMIGA